MNEKDQKKGLKKYKQAKNEANKYLQRSFAFSGISVQKGNQVDSTL